MVPVALVFPAALCLVCTLTPAQSVELSGSMPLTGDVQQFFQLSPDGAWAVYLADQVSDEVFELFSVPTVGGAKPVKLNGPLVAGGDVLHFNSIRISSDSQWVVFIADQQTNDVFELFSAPIDGSSAAVKLNAPLPPGGNLLFSAQTEFEISPDGTRVVYRADQDADEVFELYSVLIDASAAPVKLNGPMVAGGGIRTIQDCFRISSDGTRVVYVADEDTNEVVELFSVPIDGSAAPVKLHDPFPFLSDVSSFQIAPDGARVVYVADQESDGLFELFSVPIDASLAPVPLDVRSGDFQFSPDSVYVVLRAALDEPGVFEVYAVPADGDGTAFQLNGPLVPGGDVISFRISPDATRVVYRADQDADSNFGLYSVPIDGTDSAIRIDSIGMGQYQLTSDSSRAVFQSDQVFSVPLDGSGPAVAISAPLVPGGDLGSFQLSPDGQWVVYQAEQDTEDVFELYSVAIDGTPGPFKVSGPMIPLGDAIGFDLQVTAAGRIVYRADQEIDEVVELYGTTLIPAHVPRHARRAGL